MREEKRGNREGKRVKGEEKRKYGGREGVSGKGKNHTQKLT